MSMRVVVVVVFVCAIVVAACSSPGSENLTSGGGEQSVASQSSPAESVPQTAAFVEGTDVRAYFDSAGFLSEPEITGRVPNQFAGRSANPLVDFDFSRTNIRASGFNPRFLTEQEINQKINEWDIAAASHPNVTYVYECSDGRHAHVDHFVRDDIELRNVWQRDDFFSEVAIHEPTGQTTFWPYEQEPGPDGEQLIDSLIGVLQPTNTSPGPYSGAEYIYRTSIDTTFGAFLFYGFYQYYSFVDQDGIEVEVLVTAASFDYDRAAYDSVIAPFAVETLEYTDAELDEIVGETIAADSVEPLELIDHERVQARIECGRELDALVAPLIAELDQSRN